MNRNVFAFDVGLMSNAAVATVDAADFSGRASQLVDQIEAGTIERIFITKLGHVVAVVGPRPQAESEFNLHEILPGTVMIPEGFDETAPVFEGAMHAEEGRVHE